MYSYNNNIKHICIIRLSALGDVTHVLPVISTLKDYNPDIKITWIIGKREYQLLSHIKDINFRFQ